MQKTGKRATAGDVLVAVESAIGSAGRGSGRFEEQAMRAKEQD